MATSVQITAIICLTLVAVCIIGQIGNKGDKK